MIRYIKHIRSVIRMYKFCRMLIYHYNINAAEKASNSLSNDEYILLFTLARRLKITLSK